MISIRPSLRVQYISGERYPNEVSRENEKKVTPRTQLSGPTLTYTVKANDTLTSIAARFDTTPSELTKTNRLSTRFLFPGQLLTVPDKGGAKENEAGPPDHLNEALKDSRLSPLLVDIGRSASPQGGSFPRTPANSLEIDRSLDRECLERFLKIQVRHITDGQGVVAGVLLVTPNAVMFDPNVSDPLVIERGPESYGVIAPMDFVVNAALYYDIAHMKVKDSGIPKPDMPKPEIYYGPEELREESSEDHLDGVTPCDRLNAADVVGIGGSEESPSKEGPLPDLISHDNDNDSSCSCGGDDTRETSAFPKAFEHELLTPVGSDASPPGGEAPPPFVQSDLATITEAPKAEELTPAASPLPPYQVAQSQCDTTVSTQDLAQKSPLHTSASVPLTTNDKKRTTSVTFSTSSESDMPPLPEDGTDIPSQESRKQKVLKRISYPLSWMENFNPTERDGQMMNQNQPMPSSAPPSGSWGTFGAPNPAGGDSVEGGKPGMFSNVFSMSNVSNMLTRRPSLDTFRRPSPTAGTQLLQGDSQAGNHPHYSTGLQLDVSNQKRAQFKEGPRFGLKSMVSMDDMPELFASFDKLIPKPASCCDESPLYLCLRMGTPIDKPISRTTPIMTYGKKCMRPEYWFSIPQNRTEELYHFFQIWASHLYGELDEEAIRKRGFQVVEEEIDICPQGIAEEGGDEFFGAAGELKEMTKESWEKIKAPYAKLYSLMKSQMTISQEAEHHEAASMSDELRRALYSSNSLTSLDLEAFLPEVQGSTEVIDDSIRKNMYRNLPARVQGYNWKLIFSTAEHGFSLKSLYRKMYDIDSPIILLIQDTQQNKFGALLSCPLRVSDFFYGTGETFLFICQPEFQVFPWTGENTFFVKGNNESLYIGGGDGKFGIWLDGDLYNGRTQPCKTYGNPALTSSEDFIIKTVECWFFD